MYKKFSFLLILAMAITLLLSSTVYGEDTVEDRISSLEEELADLKSSVDSAEEERFEDMLRSVQIHGFISQGYIKSNRNNYRVNSEDGSFEFNELGINFSTQITDKLRIGVQLLSQDFGTMGNNKIKVDWAYADYRWRDWLGLRAGNMKNPVGMFSETRDIDMCRNTIFLPTDALYDESLRELTSYVQGIGIYGSVPMDVLGTMNYQALWGYSRLEDDGGTARAINSLGMGTVESLDSKYTWTVNLVWETPIDGLRFGGAQCSRKTTADVDPVGTLTFDDVHANVGFVEYTIGDLVMYYECFRYAYQLEGFFGEAYRESFSWHVGADYRFCDWFAMGGWFANASWKTPAGRASAKANAGDYHAADHRDLCVAARFDITDNWLFKVEGHFIDGTYLVSGPDGREPNTKPDMFMLAFKTTVSF